MTEVKEKERTKKADLIESGVGNHEVEEEACEIEEFEDPKNVWPIYVKVVALEEIFLGLSAQDTMFSQDGLAGVSYLLGDIRRSLRKLDRAIG